MKPYNSIELKIRRKNLAAESRDIRKEELAAKAKRDTALLTSLNRHRLDVVRPAARSAHLAHAFLKCRDYSTVENRDNTRTGIDIAEIARIAAKYGPPEYRTMDRDDLKSILHEWWAGRYVFPEETETVDKREVA